MKSASRTFPAGLLAGFVLVTTIAAINLGASGSAGAVPVSGKRIVGYFAQWGIYKRNYLVKNVDTSGSAERMTHINYAFSDISASLKCATADAFADYNKAFDASESVDGVGDTFADPVKANFRQLYKLKQKWPHLKVLISIGGWTLSTNFSDAALPANRAAFVASCIDMYINGNFEAGKVLPGVFDGIDLDWEYPGACGATCNFRPEDKQNFTALVQEFRNQLTARGQQTGKTYLLTAATSAGENHIANLEIGSLAPLFDWINIMTYDFHGAWETTTNMHSALYGVPADPTYESHLWSDYAVNLYLAGGVPASKLTMGIPLYGRGWGGVPAGPNGDGLYQSAGGRPPRGKYENGIDDYKTMPAREATFAKYFHPVGESVYIYNGSQLWTYDDPASAGNKASYILSKNLSGAMFWELSGDTTNVALLGSIYNGLNGGAPSPTSTPTATPTARPTATATSRPRATATSTATATSRSTATATATSGATATATSTATATPTSTSTPTGTPTSRPTATPTSGGGAVYRSPGAHAAGATGDGNGYESNPAGALADGGTAALDMDGGTDVSQSCGSPVRDTHVFSNFGLAASAAGIEVRLDAFADRNQGTPGICVDLSWDGGATWTTGKRTPDLEATETTYLLGGSTDTWGHAWSSTDLSDANFRVRLTNVSNTTVRDVSVDWVAVKVY